MQNVFTIVSSTNPGNFRKDGAYVDPQSAQPNLPAGPASNVVAIVGAGSWGKPNLPLPASDSTSAQAAIGQKTSVNKSALREWLSALGAVPNSGIQALFVRVTDGTDAEAVMDLLDSQSTPAPVLIGTAVCSGSDGNFASIRADLQSGTLTTSPVFVVTVYGLPGTKPLVYPNIIGYATVGGAYDAATFKANALAALNGTAPNTSPNPYFVFTAGSSTSAPNVGTVFAATGGTDGDSGVTDATTQGVSEGVSSTGMYVLSKQIAGAQLVLAAFDTVADFANVAQFAFQEGAFGWETFPAGTDTTDAVSAKTENNMSNDSMGVVMDWDEVFDTYQGKSILVSPIGAVAGIVASLPPQQYPGNNPTTGVSGITTTERLELGAIDDSEAAQRQSNGILYIGVTPNGVLGLPHGLTSSGIQINVVRMRNYVAYGAGTIMGKYVGAMLETNLPIAQADESDPRIQCQAALLQWGATMTQPGNRMLAAFNVILNDTNNTPATMEEAFLIATILGTTLTGVQFALAVVQVGNTVQIQTSPLPSAA